MVTLALWERFDFTIVGPEAPLAAGLVDRLTSRGFAAFGPTGAAAHIESSKRFAKEIMTRAHVPTARATWHTSVDSAKEAVRATGAPVVIKASGLASGKGVIVCDSVEAADRAKDAVAPGSGPAHGARAAQGSRPHQVHGQAQEDHARQLADQILDAPETSTRQNSALRHVLTPCPLGV